MLALWECGNQKTDTNICYSIILFSYASIEKKLLMSKQISDDIKQFSYEICQKHKVIIRYMETDKGERCPVDICYDPTEMECRPIFIT